MPRLGNSSQVHNDLIRLKFKVSMQESNSEGVRYRVLSKKALQANGTKDAGCWKLGNGGPTLEMNTFGWLEAGKWSNYLEMCTFGLPKL
jgi:hypothetical protein